MPGNKLLTAPVYCRRAARLRMNLSPMHTSTHASTGPHPAPSELLASLLAPLDVANLLDERWLSHTQVLAASAERLAVMPSVEVVREAMTRAPLLKTVTTDRAGKHREVRMTGDDVHACIARGESVCAGAVDRVCEPLQRVGRAVTQGVGIVGGFEVNVYHSPAGVGFPLHFDGHSVWIFQVGGSKRWWVGAEPLVEHPIGNGYVEASGQANFPEWLSDTVPQAADLLDVTLHPGDVLYVPPGTWHRTRAMEESLSFVVSQSAISRADVLTQVLRSQLLRESAWRAPVSRSHHVDPRHEIEVMRGLVLSLAASLPDLDVRALVEAARAQQ